MWGFFIIHFFLYFFSFEIFFYFFIKTSIIYKLNINAKQLSLYFSKVVTSLKKVMVMKELKPIDYKLLFELMKDSHRSDRQLAKSLGVSQPTITRRRALLEENYLQGYTVIPKFFDIGFEIFALTFFRTSIKKLVGKSKEDTIKQLKDWYLKLPGVIIVAEGMGMGWDTVCFSIHENFTNYTQLRRSLESELSDWIVECESFIINLRTNTVYRPFHLKSLAVNKKAK